MSPNPSSISWKWSVKRLNCFTHATDSCTPALEMAPITAPRNPTGVWFTLRICMSVTVSWCACPKMQLTRLASQMYEGILFRSIWRPSVVSPPVLEGLAERTSDRGWFSSASETATSFSPLTRFRLYFSAALAAFQSGCSVQMPIWLIMPPAARCMISTASHEEEQSANIT